MIDEHGGIAYALARRLVGDPGMAEDVVQETLISLWRQAATYDSSRGSLRTWFLTAVRNRAVDRIRAERIRPTSAAVDIDSAVGLEAPGGVWTEVSASLERTEVRRAIASLPCEQREAIELGYFGGLTHVEIARRVGAPLGTVKGRLRLGLLKLRAELAPAFAA